MNEVLPDLVPHLTREQQFEKKGMQSNDSIVVYTTLWTRAADIPCQPRARVAIHSLAILGAIGGWRLGARLPSDTDNACCQGIVHIHSPN